jgi:flagellar assembly protein FliH
VLAQARIEAEEIRARSREEGLAEGRAMGLAECRPARAALEEWFERLDLAFQEFCEAQIPALVDLAVSAAEVLLREQLDLAPERIRAVCRDALDRVAGASGVTVYLHPDDIPLVVDSCQLTVDSGDGAPPSLSTVNGQLSTGVIVPDPTLERGGCRIESDCGTVDATISGRVARLRAAMSDPS